MSTPIHTAGYQGLNLNRFLDMLRGAGVTLLADIRAVPLSRVRGFSKTPLSQALKEAGIAYEHVRELGNPKHGRDAAKRGDEATFRSVYAGVLGSDAGAQGLARIGDLARSGTVCMMCFERHHTQCHRGMVADTLESRGYLVRHLSTDAAPQAAFEFSCTPTPEQRP